ncbi:hypothetical protein [Verrucomicrobium spinosum]|uniref:hypothetical protein n=1 Tax=Verrucomicrobium spinosum TaxID=2736 RepID=UPI00094681E2
MLLKCFMAVSIFLMLGGAGGINAQTLSSRNIAAGSSHTVMLKSDGTVWSLGGNWNGTLGDGTSNSSSVPVQSVGLTGVIEVAAEESHSVAVKSDGTVWAFGANHLGSWGTEQQQIIPHRPRFWE